MRLLPSITIILAVGFFQVFVPHFYVYNVPIFLDFFLILLFVLSLFFKQFGLLLFAIALGAGQDLLSQQNLLGLSILSKLLLAWFLGEFCKHRENWPLKLRLFATFSMIFMHFSLVYYVILNGTNVPFFDAVVAQFLSVILNFVTIYFLNQFFFRQKLL